MDNLTINCGACRDLLPLVAEGMASGESAALAVAHMEGCEDCRAELERIKEQPAPEQMPLDESMRKTKQKLRNKRLLTAIISAVTAMVLFCTGYHFLFNYLIFPKTPPSDLQCSVEDGIVTLTASHDSIYGYADGREIVLEDGSKVYLIMFSMADPPARKYFPRLYRTSGPVGIGDTEHGMNVQLSFDKGSSGIYRVYFIQEWEFHKGRIEIDETMGKLTENSMQYAALVWEETVE